jgi:metal transporter CNNM
MFGLEGDANVFMDIGIVVLTTVMAGCMSGLTLSLFSLDENYLNTVAKGPNRKLAKRASRILELVQNPHWLLITMLIMNAASVETMPLILDELINPVAAVAISVSLVLIFGEIIPQALFVRHALTIGSFFYLPLRLLMILTSPVSFTVGKLLDVLVGHREAVFFRRQELRAFIRLQAEMKQDQNDASPLLNNSSDQVDSSSMTRIGDDEKAIENEKMTAQEINIMLGALSLTESTVATVLKTKIDEIVCLSADTVLTKEVVQRLFSCGFSRIPVYEGSDPSSISQYLITKTLVPLIFRFENEAPKVRDLTLRQPSYCSLSTPVIDVYQQIQKSGSHMFFVTRDTVDVKSTEVVGLMTSHDVFELMHQTSFRDEMDLRASAPVQMIMRSWQSVQLRRQIAAFRGGGGAAGDPRNSNLVPRSNAQYGSNNRARVATQGGPRTVGTLAASFTAPGNYLGSGSSRRATNQSSSRPTGGYGSML